MNTDTQRAILGLALMAAFADGDKDDRERQQIRQLADQLGGASGGTLDVAGLMQDVLLQRFGLEQAVAALQTPAHRQLAYEMAVCVCDADGMQGEAEQRFLAELKRALGLGARQAATVERQADAIAELVGPAGGAVAAGGLPAERNAEVAPALPATTAPQASEAEIDKSVLNYALLNGALELLPQSWASMAIIPLQMKMVYGIGKVHGYELDRGHVREFIAAAGVGMTSQYLEQFGRKLLGGLLGKALGRTIGGVGKAATGVAFSFATTYALGQLARRYYAGGRQMNTAVLQQTFQSLLGPAREMQQQYLPQIRQKASTLDAASVMKMIKP